MSDIEYAVFAGIWVGGAIILLWITVVGMLFWEGRRRGRNELR